MSALALSARAAAALALLLLSVVGVRFGPPLRGAAAAPRCAWSRHPEQIAGESGQPDAAGRHRVHWSCDPVIALTEPPIPATTAGPPQPTPAPAGTAEPGRADYLGVRSREYEFALSRPSLASGEVTIELDNQGAEAHNLNLQRDGGAGEPVLSLPDIDPAKRQIAHFELPPGRYRLWCSLPGHARKGMRATLVVR